MAKTALKRRINAFRNPIFIVYSFAGVIIFLLGMLLVKAGVSTFEKAIFELFNKLPGALDNLFVAISFFGTIGFVFVATFISLIRKHYTHAIKFLLAGVLAWLAAKWLKTYELRMRPSEILPNVQLREKLDSTIGYPSGHAAVATALGLIAYQYVPKKYHRLITVLVIGVYISRLYLGMHLPIDIVGGFAVGLVIASFLNFAFGDTRGKNIPISLIKRKLQKAGMEVSEVKKAKVDARGSTPFFATLQDGTKIFIKVVDSSNNVADWLFKLSRRLMYRRLEDEAPFLTSKRQLEHEAYVAGLALSNGINTPQIKGIFHVKDDMWAMAQVMIDGSSLDSFEEKDVTSKLMHQIWQQVHMLHKSRIIHRDLRAANVFVDKSNNPWMIDFGFSEASVPVRSFNRDIVELIASLSCIVDPAKVVKVAHQELGKDALISALPYMGYASLSGATTKLLKKREGGVNKLRDLLIKETGTETVSKARVARFDLKTLLIVAMIGLALWVFIPQIGDFQDSIATIKDADLRYVVIAFMCSIVTYLAAAGVYVFISIFPLKYFRTLLVETSTSFTNRVLPASTGSIATNVRYLSKSGYNTLQAGSLTALNNLVGFLGHITIMIIIVTITKTPLSQAIQIPIPKYVLIIVGLVLVSISILVFVVPKWKRKAVSIFHKTKKDLRELTHEPTRFIFSLLCAMTITSFYALALYFSAQAVGVHITILQAFIVFTLGVATASVTPTPGGIGGAEAGLVAGFVSIGLDSGTALTITLLYRLLTYWIPILPGFIAFQIAMKRKYI